jgi:hypothetical protein
LGQKIIQLTFCQTDLKPCLLAAQLAIQLKQHCKLELHKIVKKAATPSNYFDNVLAMLATVFKK